MLNNTEDFAYSRHQLLTTYADTRYHKTSKSSTNDQAHDKHMQNQLLQPTDNNELRTRKILIIHQRYEKRLSNNHRHIHELWIRTFHGTAHH